MPFELRAMGVEVTACENAPVDCRVERLDSSVEYLGRAGEVRDLRDRQPRVS